MNTYQYTAKDKNSRTVIGVLEGSTEAEIAGILHKKDLVVVEVRQIKTSKIKVKAKKVKLDDLVIFSRQLATMIEAGIPLAHALGILGEQIENKNFRETIIVVRQDIEAGVNFPDALKKHPNVFSELFVNMARAGETSGMLNEILERLAAYLEKQAALARKVISSLIYPAVVVSMAILITAFLLLKVVPTFKSIFATLGGQLPVPTQILIMISDSLKKYFLYLLGVLAIGGGIFKKYISTEKGRLNFDFCLLKLPVIGELFRKVAVAKFSRTFSTLVKSGVSIMNTLEIVSKTSGNKVVEKAIASCLIAVRDGEQIWLPLSKSGVFPLMVTRMIAVGEQTGQLEKMLSKIADYYDEQVDAATQALSSLVEPLVIAFLGMVVGGIVVSLFLPIFKITELISK
ncbi:MAG: type II secretion system F family protein [Candidatus Omnitrophota bacterium]|nr:type II secretion system F family protein [Candidatus Omnitrophota bacterium]